MSELQELSPKRGNRGCCFERHLVNTGIKIDGFSLGFSKNSELQELSL